MFAPVLILFISLLLAQCNYENKNAIYCTNTSTLLISRVTENSKFTILIYT